MKPRAKIIPGPKTMTHSHAPNLTVRSYRDGDWPAVWRVLEPTFRAGDSYPCPPDITEDEAKQYWIEAPAHTLVAFVGDDLVGTYYMRPDQMGLGDHVCNCGYVVAAAARGRGIAVALCLHSQDEARQRGYTAMKFNLVVASNEAAVKAWLKCGMRIVGTIPKAFRHKTLGLVAAHIMYKDLDDAL